MVQRCQNPQQDNQTKVFAQAVVRQPCDPCNRGNQHTKDAQRSRPAEGWCETTRARPAAASIQATTKFLTAISQKWSGAGAPWTGQTVRPTGAETARGFRGAGGDDGVTSPTAESCSHRQLHPGVAILALGANLDAPPAPARLSSPTTQSCACEQKLYPFMHALFPRLNGTQHSRLHQHLKQSPAAGRERRLCVNLFSPTRAACEPWMNGWM